MSSSVPSLNISNVFYNKSFGFVTTTGWLRNIFCVNIKDIYPKRGEGGEKIKHIKVKRKSIISENSRIYFYRVLLKKRETAHFVRSNVRSGRPERIISLILLYFCRFFGRCFISSGICTSSILLMLSS